MPAELGVETFHCVTLFHVLEHVLDFRALLARLRAHLHPRGVLCVEVPDWGSWPRRLHGMDWMYVLPHHVNYFTRATLVRAAAFCGLSPRHTERRRQFAVNERRPWREPLKRFLAALGWGNILRVFFVPTAVTVPRSAAPV